MGTEILINGQPDAEWEAFLDEGWDRECAAAVASRFPELVLQQVSEQRPHKASYKLFAADAAQAAGVVSNLRGQLSAAKLDTNVVFSGGEDLDILPSRASKGKALAFLMRQLYGESAAPPPLPGGVLVCGDSGNDAELFAVEGVHGCVVANAHAELREWCAANGHDRIFEATRDGPGGIHEALHHWGFVRERSMQASAGQLRRDAVVHLHQAFESWYNASDASEATLAGAGDGGTAAEEEGAVLGEAPDVLESVLGAEFELLDPGGSVITRQQLLTWFREKARGSKGGVAALLAPPSADPLTLRGSLGGGGSLAAAQAAEGEAAAAAAKFRIWIDRYSEREVAPGVWVVRYQEVQQRFPPSITAGTPTSSEGGMGGSCTGRTVRWSSAVLREEEGEGWGRYKWLYVHETWVADSGRA